MEGSELLDHVERTWPFNAESYLVLARLDGDEAVLFSLTHVMKHQAKGIAWINAVRIGTFLPEITEVKIRLLNLMTNCLRFHRLLEGSPEAVERTLSWWGTVEARPCDTVTLNRIKHSDSTFRRAVHDFFEGTLFTLGLLEKPDHGGTLPKERLLEMSYSLMTACVEMLTTFGITKDAYVRYLLKDTPAQVLAR
jgi:hypothetical protein